MTRSVSRKKRRRKKAKRSPPGDRAQTSEPRVAPAADAEAAEWKRPLTLTIFGWLLGAAAFASLFGGGYLLVRGLGRPGGDDVLGGSLFVLSASLKLVGAMYVWERNLAGLWLFLVAEAALVAGAIVIGWTMLASFGAPVAVVAGTFLWLAITSAPERPAKPP